MSGRPKRRGRPPKTPNSDKPKFQMHLLKKPKYLQNADAAAASCSTPQPQSSRRSGPAAVAAVVDKPSRATRRSVQKPVKTSGTPKAKASLSRSSTAGSKKKKSLAAAADKGHDYHYGSDFDESDKSDESSESEQSDTNIEDIDDGTDSDFSVGGFSVASRARKSNITYIRNPSPEPLWLRNDEQIPKLELPKSSEDLLVPAEHVMQAVCVYEVLRRFKSQVKYCFTKKTCVVVCARLVFLHYSCIVSHLIGEIITVPV